MQWILLLVAGAVAAEAGAEKASLLNSELPSDVARSHHEEITTGTHRYTIRQGGTMDGHGALHTMPAYLGVIYNGLWEYRPDFSRELWREGAASIENISGGSDGLAADDGQRGSMTVCFISDQWIAVSMPCVRRTAKNSGPSRQVKASGLRH